MPAGKWAGDVLPSRQLSPRLPLVEEEGVACFLRRHPLSSSPWWVLPPLAALSLTLVRILSLPSQEGDLRQVVSLDPSALSGTPVPALSRVVLALVPSCAVAQDLGRLRFISQRRRG